MRNISDSTIRNLFIAALIVTIIILALFSTSVFAAGSGGGVIVGGRIGLLIPTPTNIGTPPWVCATTPCPPPGDLQQRLIGPQYVGNVLADVIIYGPQIAKQYRHLLMPLSSPYCSSPRAGAFFIGQGIPAGPGQTALLMTVIGCSR